MRRAMRAMRVRCAACLTFVVGLSACDTLLNVEDPDIIEPNQLESLQGAEALYNGAIGDFTMAKDGGAAGPGSSVGIVVAGGWFTDEFRFGGTPPLARAMDLRDMDPENVAWNQVYLNLHVARLAAERAAELFQQVSPDPSAEARIGELYALSGLTHILLGEHYCSGIPFSSTEPDLEYGAPLTTDQVMDRGIARLDLADRFTAGSSDVANLTKVARGRALLNQGNYAAAATAVSGVPTDFLYQSLHSANTERQANVMYLLNFESDQYSVSDLEGVNGLDFATAGDPRVPTQFVGVSGFDGETPMYRYLKFSSRASPVETASGIEARMIEAEAQLDAGDFGGWLITLNDARATLTMAPLSDPGTADARVDLMFRERAFWLFNTGHRLGDLRRLVRQYGRDPLTVYPVGAYHKDNLTRGSDLSIVIPANEGNNPQYVPCDDQIA
ncbi:MAG: hypothetical protein OEO79_17415 [Gemmatimonadota bacterium]|nr:hypothetical protein [Gemmatimonadota bacterium]